MRGAVNLSFAGLLAAAAVLALAGSACSQVPATDPAPATVAPPPARDTTEASKDALSPEDQNARPFPPGRYASTVKRVCTECHAAGPILSIKFSKEEATRYYKNMVSSNLDTEEAKQIIEYLSTTLGR